MPSLHSHVPLHALLPSSQTRGAPSPFVLVGERLWLDFVNTDDVRRGSRIDLLRDFDALVRFLEAVVILDAERATGMRRRAQQQPAGAAAALVDARRVRAALRALAERGAHSERVRGDALAEINRVLGRSAGTRRVESRADGSFARAFVPVGDAFAGLIIPVVESAADALIAGELPRVRRCGDPRCSRVFFDNTRNGRRRWCDMATCGNRAKAARFRERERHDTRRREHQAHGEGLEHEPRGDHGERERPSAGVAPAPPA
ncbi:MAG TPA: CGNR zinc finger domain-containing protein [Gemmatimonadaceae bacterium]|nr:CGNR zinc finger domain-containing protein [Gemmatimonadaceae bacterium]